MEDFKKTRARLQDKHFKKKPSGTSETRCDSHVEYKSEGL